MGWDKVERMAELGKDRYRKAKLRGTVRGGECEKQKPLKNPGHTGELRSRELGDGGTGNSLHPKTRKINKTRRHEMGISHPHKVKKI